VPRLHRLCAATATAAAATACKVFVKSVGRFHPQELRQVLQAESWRPALRILQMQVLWVLPAAALSSSSSSSSTVFYEPARRFWPQGMRGLLQARARASALPFLQVPRLSILQSACCRCSAFGRGAS
tara:strand:- start:442 stop:822 length:381 start_codon:yes stop_codon:yes gene_type:complete